MARKNTSAAKRLVIINMGCSKNLVDSERLALRLADIGYKVDFDGTPTRGRVVVVNTCGFIGDAKEESVNMLVEIDNMKKKGRINRYYIMGCLSQRYRANIESEFPLADGIFGKFDWAGIVADLKAVAECDNTPHRRDWERCLSTAPYSAYIKISEGCNRFCAFCAIPLITGRHHSRTADDIIEEVTTLAASGTCEFNIIAQDLSSYGRDLADASSTPLADLLERMAAIPGVEMIRLHYAYPSDFPYEILPVMARHANICKYLDIALQHIDDTVLANMRRHITAEQTRALLARIRAEVPGIHIRTTLMTGFPGETDEAFDRLMQFVAEQRFERAGAFAYCEEDDTYAAAHFADDIPEEVKQQRLDRLMDLCETIGREVAEEKIGKTLRVLVTEAIDGEPRLYRGRTEYDSPEVDNEVYITSDEKLEAGKVYDVVIDSAEYMDLNGHIAQ